MGSRSSSTRKRESYQVKAVDRALRILTCFNLTQPELTLSEICDLTDLPKPTVFRLLASLEAARFVERTADQQRYKVGIRLFELGKVYISNLSIERVMTPHMQRITEKHKIVCNLAVLDEGQVVYIASTEQRGPYRHAAITGYRHYIHCSALGKALVIDHPDQDIKDILAERGMPALSPHTITDPDQYLLDLEQAREKGFTVDDQEGAVGIYCMAVPIRNRDGKVIAAVSVSGPSPKFTDEIKNMLVQDMQYSVSVVQNQL